MLYCIIPHLKDSLIGEALPLFWPQSPNCGTSSILNVRTTTKGIQKRDNIMDPVKSSVDFKLQILMDFAEFLQCWEGLQHLGLT